jgi:hypothetical protein
MKRTALVIALFFVGCGSSKPAPEEPAPSQGGGDLLSVCVKTIERQYECTDDFIPALVDMRIKHGLLPPDAVPILEEEGGRDKLIQIAMDEWKVDGVEPKRTETCQKMLQVVSPEEGEKLKAAGEKCLAATDCKAFLDCMMPVMEAQMTQEPRPAPDADMPDETPMEEPLTDEQ